MSCNILPIEKFTSTVEVYVFSDCSYAIDILTKQSQLNKHSEILEKIRHICKFLAETSSIIKLVKIPRHKGIHGNELVDQNAKQMAQTVAKQNTSVSNVISISDACRIASEIAKKSWQRRWNEDSKGRQTYEYIPIVGTKMLWPRKQGIGISYCRIFLHDTMNKDSHRTGTSDTPICDCGMEEETVTHLLLT